MDGPPVHERWGPLAAVILAAGEGSRLGGPKQVAEVGGEPLVVRALRLALQSDAEEIVVVTGAHAQQTAQALTPWTAQPASRVRVVHNAAWASGQASSMQAGLAALSPATQAALLLPVDQPFLPVSLLRRLASLWRAGWPIAARASTANCAAQRRPCSTGRCTELHAVRGDRGGRDVLRSRLIRDGRCECGRRPVGRHRRRTIWRLCEAGRSRFRSILARRAHPMPASRRSAASRVWLSGPEAWIVTARWSGSSPAERAMRRQSSGSSGATRFGPFDDRHRAAIHLL